MKKGMKPFVLLQGFLKMTIDGFIKQLDSAMHENKRQYYIEHPTCERRK